MKKKHSHFERQLTRHLLLAVLLICSWASIHAQVEQRYWIFGQGNTPFNLEFNQGSPTTTWSSIAGPPALPTTAPGAFGTEGTGVANDPVSGALLFFTDGASIYGGPPSFPLIGTGLGGHPSSAQPVAMCAMPTCPLDSVFIFSNGSGSTTSGYNIGTISYRIFRNTSQTFGPVTALPTALSAFAEGMIVVPSSTVPGEYWLITHEYATNVWQIFRVNSSGVSLNQTISEGPNVMGIGNLAFTPVSVADPNVGEIAAIYSISGPGLPAGVFRLRFDPSLGLIIPNTWFGVRSNANWGGVPYDVEWSPNGQYLYYSRYTTGANAAGVWQHDIALANTNIAQGTYPANNTDFNVFTSGLSGQPNTRGGGLKLGPDGRIYHIQDIGPATFVPSPVLGQGAIGVIPNPNNASPIYNQNQFTTANVLGYNFPEFITFPAWSVDIFVQGCPAFGLGQTVTLGSNIVSLGQSASYQWYNGATNQPIPGATGSTLVISAAGTYYLQVTFGNGCPITSDPLVVVDDPNCCYLEQDQSYTQFTANVLYNTPTTLDERLFVHPGVTITVDGTVLDLANVDLVFGQCAGIEVINGGSVIANNSVFRPCDLERSWKGITFQDGSTGSFNECSFVNASTALSFSSLGGQTEAAITNNLFKNCRTSILVFASLFDESISGNTFTVTDDLVLFSESGCLGQGVQNNQHFGILGFASQFQDLVSQNDFVDGTLFPDTKEFQGVVMEGGSIDLSQNTFSNLFRAIDFMQVVESTVENNTFEITRNRQNLQHQVRIADSEDIVVVGNKMSNSIYYDNFTAQRSAIYIENSAYQYVHKNEINGFESAVALQSVDVSTIGENQIKDGNLYGIYVEEGTNIDLTCNSIKMRTDGNSTGIQFIQSDDSDHKIRIRNNCIFDTHTAIYMFAITGRAEIPTVTNNFLYNYFTGIYNDGFTGGIGTGSAFADAGRNTFNSNNFPPGAFDIFSTTPISAVGNSGILNVNANVAVSQNNVYSSGASCAAYILSIKNELTPAENCDNGFTISNFLRQSGIGLSQTDLDDEKLMELHPRIRLATATAILAALTRDGLPGEQEKMIRFLDDNPEWLSLAERTRLDFRLALNSGDLDAARIAMQSPGASEPGMAGWATLARILVKLHENGEGPASLSTADLILLKAIDEEGSFAAAQARDLIHAAIGGHDYLFKPVKVFKHDLSGEPSVKLDENKLQVFPNPAGNLIHVRAVHLGDAQAHVRVFDATGRKFIDHAMGFNAGTLSLDLSEIPSGMYLIQLSDNDGTTLSHKFIRK